MTDAHSSPGPGSDPDLDELLELAARLASPDEDDRVWQRSVSGGADRFSHMLRHVDAGDRQQAAGPPSDLDDSRDGTPGDVPADVPADVPDGTAGDAVAEPPGRALVPVPEATTGWRIHDPLGTIPLHWRRPAGIGSAVAAAGLVLGVGLHTFGPAVGFTPYTPAPVTAGGSPQATYQSIPVWSPPAVSTLRPSVSNPLSVVRVASSPARPGSSPSTAPTAG